MTTDITELAQREKFEAWARSQKLSIAYGDCGYVYSSTEMAWRAVKALSAELVEALEKAQATEAHRNLGWKESHEQEARAEAAEKRIAELESRTVQLPPLNDDLIAILGRPNFMCAHLAELLRKSGEDIKRKSEHEQAAIIHWFLSIYLEHGDKWEGIAKSDIQARAAGIKWEGE